MVHRDIEVNSQSSSGEKENEKPKKSRKTKKIPEPPVRKQSIGPDQISSPSQDYFQNNLKNFGETLKNL